jgi:predicted Zn-dependent peptidase
MCRRVAVLGVALQCLLVVQVGCAGARTAGQVDRAKVPERAPPRALDLPAQQRFELPNGLKVRLIEQHRLPVVALHLVVRAGAVLDPAGSPGLANLTATLLDEGTTARNAFQISDALGALGASLSVGTGSDSAFAHAQALSRHLPAVLDIMSEVVRKPAFPARDFARVKDEMLVTLLQQRDQPQVMANRAFTKIFWGAHPYGHWTMGSEASLKAMKREDLARFHKANWLPGSSELVVVGDVTRAQLEPLLKTTFGEWKGERPAPAPKAASGPATQKVVLVEKLGAPQAYLMLGVPAVDRASPEHTALEVALEILGGSSASRLFRNLREKHGYTYGIYARADTRRLGGASVIAGSTKTEVTGAAMKELLAELAAMRDKPVTPAELADAKGSLVLSLPAQFSTVAGIASKVAEEIVYDLPEGYWDRYAQEVAKVTAEGVQRAAQAYLDPKKMTVVMTCDPKAIQPQLEGLPLGPVEVMAAGKVP